MSNYNSDNTLVLETYDQKHLNEVNKRMLLLYKRGDGTYEYIIGSYFEETRYEGALGYEHWDYSWYWGHYFNDLVEAVDYWKAEVLGKE